MRPLNTNPKPKLMRVAPGRAPADHPNATLQHDRKGKAYWIKHRTHVRRGRMYPYNSVKRGHPPHVAAKGWIAP